MSVHHIERLNAAFPAAHVSAAPRFNPFRAWLQRPMLYGALCALVMAVIATLARMYIYDLHTRLRIEDTLTVGGIVVLGISCGWYAQTMGWRTFVWVNRVVSASAFVIAAAPVVLAL